MIQTVVPHMQQPKSERIINISLVAGKIGTPTYGTYSATTFALEALRYALRLELTP